MAKPADEYTDEQLQKLGRWVIKYWNSFGEDKPMSGGDFIEELGWQIERGNLWNNNNNLEP